MDTPKPERQRFNWTMFAVLIFIHLAALSGIWLFSWSAVAAAAVVYAITGGFGVSLCLHRMLTHNAFKAKPWFYNFLLTTAALAFQSGPITWVGTHRAHHAYSDTPRDPHDTGKGFWWSHVGWMVHQSQEPYQRLAPKSLQGGRYARFLEKRMLVPTIILAVILYALGGLPWVIWGTFVRIVVLLNVTWCVNSVAHFFGYRNYATEDRSRNVGIRGPLGWIPNAILNVVSFGEFLHNNHHADEHSARLSHRWWEFDPMWPIILLLEKLGLVHDVVRPGFRATPEIAGAQAS